jgi:hypothetical protein
MKLAPHLHPVSNLRMSGAVPVLPSPPPRFHGTDRENFLTLAFRCLELNVFRKLTINRISKVTSSKAFRKTNLFFSAGGEKVERPLAVRSTDVRCFHTISVTQIWQVLTAAELS